MWKLHKSPLRRLSILKIHFFLLHMFVLLIHIIFIRSIWFGLSVQTLKELNMQSVSAEDHIKPLIVCILHSNNFVV